MLPRRHPPHAIWRLTAPRAVILAEASRTAEGGTTGFGGNPEERAVLPLLLWIPDPPVIPANGCNDWGDENDGAEASGGKHASSAWVLFCLNNRRSLIQYMSHKTRNTRFIESRPLWSPNEIQVNKYL